MIFYLNCCQVCIIELGGTIGDIEGMPFVEAFRQFQFKVKYMLIMMLIFANIHLDNVGVLFLDMTLKIYFYSLVR